MQGLLGTGFAFGVCFALLIYSRRFRGPSKPLAFLATVVAFVASIYIAGSMPIEDPEAAGHCLFYCWLAGGIYVGFLERRFRRPSGVVVKEEA